MIVHDIHLVRLVLSPLSKQDFNGQLKHSYLGPGPGYLYNFIMILIVAIYTRFSALLQAIHCQSLKLYLRMTVIPAPKSGSLEAITVSTKYLWGIDNRTGVGFTTEDNNVVYCQHPCSDASSWTESVIVSQLERKI